MKKYQLLVFDFDGTLVNTIGDIAHYANRTLAHYGYPQHPVPVIQKAVGWGVHELLKKVEPELGLDAARLEEAVQFFKKNYQEKPALFSEVYPSVREMLGGPLSRARKAIVTNKPQDITVQILRALELDGFFEHVLGLYAGFPPKPDPAGMFYVMDKFGVGREKTVFIGDSAIDAETSRNAGVDFGWVEYGYDTADGQTTSLRFKSAAEWVRLV